MSNDIYFRSAFSGYNKRDVINFIEKLNAEQVERVNELNDKIRLAQTEVKRLTLELAEAKKKSAELEISLNRTDANRALNDEKAQKFDSMQGTYADIMLEAEHNAKEKVKSAEEKAEQILNEANEERKKIVAENKQIIQSSKAEFLALIDKITTSLDNTLSGIETKGNE